MVPELELAHGRFPHRGVAQVDGEIGIGDGFIQLRGGTETMQVDTLLQAVLANLLLHQRLIPNGPIHAQLKEPPIFQLRKSLQHAKQAPVGIDVTAHYDLERGPRIGGPAEAPGGVLLRASGAVGERQVGQRLAAMPRELVETIGGVDDHARGIVNSGFGEWKAKTELVESLQAERQPVSGPFALGAIEFFHQRVVVARTLLRVGQPVPKEVLQAQVVDHDHARVNAADLPERVMIVAIVPDVKDAEVRRVHFRPGDLVRR